MFGAVLLHYCTVQANPEFVEKVDNILKRSNSKLGRESVSVRDNNPTKIEVGPCFAFHFVSFFFHCFFGILNMFEFYIELLKDIDESGSQTSEEVELVQNIDKDDNNAGDKKNQ